MNSRSTVLSAQQITKVFPGKKPFTAVNGVSFTVPEGQVMGLLGPNGAGKSTLIQMLLGTLLPTSGTVRFFGLNLETNRSAILEQVGYVNGYGRLPWNLTVGENLLVHGKLFGLRRKELSDRITQMLERFRAAHLRQKLFHQLSAGESTRVMLARTFMVRPKMVLLDEPTAALDPDVCVEVRSFIREERKANGITLIYTSHNMHEVAELCDRVIFLRSGRIVAEDSPQNLTRRLAKARVRLLKPAPLASLHAVLERHKAATPHDGGWFEFEVAHDAIASTVQRLSHAGVRFEDLEIRRASLEDVFITISGAEYEVTQN